jgi:Smg protein
LTATSHPDTVHAPMFDVLVYLYENYGAFNACPDADALCQKLAAAGFDDEEISDALSWLQGLERVTQDGGAVLPARAGSFRVFSGVEIDRLGHDAIAFLTFLQGAGQLSAEQREIVIDRALAIEETPVTLVKLKVIVLMVLWSQSADVDVLLLEELLDDGEDRPLH